MKFNSKFLRPFYFLLALVLLCSHDLYIKMDSYFLKPNEEAILSLYNGTFEESENIISRDRMQDASLVFQGMRSSIDNSQWLDKDSLMTQFKFSPIEVGTYVAGVSTKARNIELSADKFNSYLEHDGVLDMLQHRTQNNLLDQDAVESYEKHVKAIFQVSDTRTDDWNTVLGYPIEFVPQSNPYEKYTGEKLDVQLLLDGQPLTNQLVYYDFIQVFHDHDHGHDHDHDGHDHDHDDHDHDHDEEGHSHDEDHENSDEDNGEHSHTSGKQLRTNDQGVVTVDFPEDGIYYLRTIYMTEVNDSDELTHQSKWATLTFEVTHNHEDHDHEHDDEEGIPTWVFIAGSLPLIGILFFVFRKKS